jgi:thiol-disulfide isomerase/thioredoxin
MAFPLFHVQKESFFESVNINFEKNIMKFFIGLLALVFVSANSHAQHSALSADEIMKEAFQTANKENKKVFIIFHASWCGWCRKMDSSMNDKSCRKFFDDNFITRYLDVDEFKEDKKALQNPGANELRTKYHGDSAGIPFWLIFDKDAKLLADSKIRPEGAPFDTNGDNVGCPSEAKEVDYFIRVLKTATSLTSVQEDAIAKRFSKNKE